MRLCVLGSTGGVGRRVVDQAVARGHHVVAVLRREPTFEARGERVELQRGDVYDGDVVHRAVHGCDAVVSALGIKRTRPLDPWSALASPRDFSSRTAVHLVAAMREHEVERVRAVSAAGVGDSRAALNPVMKAALALTQLGPMYADLERMEAVYRDSGLDWQCVRPVTLTGSAPTGAPRVVDHFGLTATISRADVATFLLDALEGDAFADPTPMIAS